MFCIFTESLTELMVTIVDLSPSCCKSSHLPALFAAYSASLSVTGKATFSTHVRSRQSAYVANFINQSDLEATEF